MLGGIASGLRCSSAGCLGRGGFWCCLGRLLWLICSAGFGSVAAAEIVAALQLVPPSLMISPRLAVGAAGFRMLGALAVPVVASGRSRRAWKVCGLWSSRLEVLRLRFFSRCWKGCGADLLAAAGSVPASGGVPVVLALSLLVLGCASFRFCCVWVLLLLVLGALGVRVAAGAVGRVIGCRAFSARCPPRSPR